MGAEPPGPDPGSELEPDSVPSRSDKLAKIQSGLGWNASSQVASVAINLGLTPYLLTSLGVSNYGLYALLSSFRGLLSNFDGGLGPTSTRYFAVYAGARDRRSTAALLVTMSVLLAGVVGLLGGAVAVFAPQITAVVHTTAGLHREAVNLLRLFMPLLLVSTVRLLFQRIITAEHRWAYMNASSTAALVVYAALAVLFISEGRGLMSLIYASAGQEAVLVVTAVAGARRSFSLRDCHFLPREVVRDLVRYASRVQVAAVASSFNFEIDSLLVGLLFPVRYVAFYSIGANVSSQLASLPTNAISPISVTLSRTYGRASLEGTITEFTSLQRLWVRAIAAFPLVGAVSVYFGIVRWLGSAKYLAGVVASILLVGIALPLLSEVMGSLAKSVKRPGIESRYLGIGMVVNIAFTVPLALTIGMLGVPAGTALGEIASAVYFLRLARREIHPELRSFFADIPVHAVVVAVAITAALEWPAFRVAPRGALGLIVCGIPALAGLGAYSAMTLGPRASLSWLSRRLHRNPQRAAARDAPRDD